MHLQSKKGKKQFEWHKNINNLSYRSRLLDVFSGIIIKYTVLHTLPCKIYYAHILVLAQKCFDLF